MESGKVRVSTLGPCTLASPLPMSTRVGDGIGNFVAEDTWVRYRIVVPAGTEDPGSMDPGPLFEKAGPREKLFFDPGRTRAAVVTCGGLCPGLNNVLRSLYLEMHHNYGVPEVLGIRYGFRGLNPINGLAPLRLTPVIVERIDKQGGTILGTSRGVEDPATMVDFLRSEKVDILFCVGGDGTLRGAHHLHEEIARQDERIAVVGIPKTIDNDVPYCFRSFGYTSALQTARDMLKYAHNEARSVLNGIGLVKLMGRDAGYITAGATLASQDVNFTLIPEVPFDLEGEGGFLAALEKRLLRRGHALVVVAEGAGQNLFDTVRKDRDASGNPRYNDIGPFLKHKISDHLKSRRIPFDLKYIDPSYLIRSVPADGEDSILCDQFARRAVHAAMAGRTDVMIGFANNAFFHVPLARVAAARKRISPEDEIWISVLATTGQARTFRTGGGAGSA